MRHHQESRSVPRGTREPIQGEGAENVANEAENTEAAAMVGEMKTEDPVPEAPVGNRHVSAAVKAWVRREIHLAQLGKSEETRQAENP